MPFTLSHPAAVVPLRPLLGRHGVLSALVIGSMAPDFPYFVNLGTVRPHVHTLASVAWFSVPAGWVAYLLFQHVLRRPGIFLLPRFLRARLDPAPQVGAFVPVTLALALGALTHVAWDAFTHDTGAFFHGLLGSGPLYRALWGFPFRPVQNGSTVLGALVLLVAIWRWVERTRPAPLPAEPASLRRLRKRARAVVAVVPPLLGLQVGGWLGPEVDGPRSLAWFGVWVVVAALSTLTLLVALLGGLVPTAAGAAVPPAPEEAAGPPGSPTPSRGR